MRIGILTSSRADYSIYYPLLVQLKKDSNFNFDIIAFGSHISQEIDNSLCKIIEDGFDIKYKINTNPLSDQAVAISESMGETIKRFSQIWQNDKYDLIFCLGDRYEMFAAVSSTVPFNLNIAHIHGGEETLGAIDNKFRHSITHMSKYHFTTTELYKRRVIELVQESNYVYNVGSLSYDNVKNLTLLTMSEFKLKFNIDLSVPTILITFHPETVSIDQNEFFINELIDALQCIKNLQFVFTMPNSDPESNIIRTKITDFVKSNTNAIAVENFGTIGYLTCMKYCKLMLGNTSSGFAEAAYFPKPVINLGDRQKGRLVTPNIINCKITKKDIIDAVEIAFNQPELEGSDMYGTGNSATRIIEVLYKIINKNSN
jgi:GDP/UDP-N,N'-diacetylbacillosamine 2-epimerase (hydrolysing)